MELLSEKVEKDFKNILQEATKGVAEMAEAKHTELNWELGDEYSWRITKHRQDSWR